MSGKENKTGPAQTIAIIPARGGSKGVPKKNIRLLAGYPLIAYSITVAKLSKEIGRVVVSTDSEEIAEISRLYGAEVPFLRPSLFAGDKSRDIEFVTHAIDWFKKNEKNIPDYLVHLRPTTPFRDPDIIDQAIRQIKQNKEATSLRSGHAASESPFKWFLKNKDGYFTGIRPQDSNDDLNKPRQSFPDVYIPDGYVDVLKSEFVVKTGTMHGSKMIGFVSPVCKEVDTPEDFEYLEFEARKTAGPLIEYLAKNYRRG